LQLDRAVCRSSAAAPAAEAAPAGADRLAEFVRANGCHRVAEVHVVQQVAGANGEREIVGVVHAATAAEPAESATEGIAAAASAASAAAAESAASPAPAPARVFGGLAEAEGFADAHIQAEAPGSNERIDRHFV